MTDLPDMRRYNLRLYPTKQEKEALELQAALCGQLWNLCLEQRLWAYRNCQFASHDARTASASKRGHKLYSRGSSVPGKFDQSKELTIVRNEFPIFKKLSSNTLGLIAKALEDAFTGYFERVKRFRADGSLTARINQVIENRAKKLTRIRSKGGRIPIFRTSAFQEACGFPKFKTTRRESKFRHGTIWHRDGSGWRLFEIGNQRCRLSLFGVTPKLKYKKREATNILSQMEARGKFPAGDRELRDMKIMRRGDKWFASIAIKCDASRKAGKCQTEIDMNLIEEFAHVKMSKNGRCATSDDAFFEKQRREFSLISKGNDSIPDGAPEIGGEPQVDMCVYVQHETDGAPEIEGEPHGVKAPLRQISPNGDSKIETNDRNSHLSNLVKSQKRIDTLLSECDTKHKKFSYRWKQKRKHVARLQSKLARQQQDFLHKWTSWIISQSRSVDLAIPDLEKVIKTGRGNQKFHGAAVKTVASVNRRVLSQCSGYTRQMLEYKGKSADIPVNVEVVKKHITAIGQDISHAVKAERKASRSIKKQEAA